MMVKRKRKRKMFRKSDEDDDESFIQLKREVSACSFCLDLNTLRIDEPLILSVASKWSRW